MSVASKPFSAACKRNRGPILELLEPLFAGRTRVLEIGSGTGQHAAHFAAAMPWLTWQASDRAENLPGIRQWLDQAELGNTPPPMTLDVAQADWPGGTYDAFFSANTLHIMAWSEVESLFAGLPAVASDDAYLAIYGPFNDAGRFSSDSNAHFDAQLKADAAHRGIRDMQAVDALAEAAGFALMADHAMPANNRLRIWRRS
ncbi:MAG: DUF938 domain-containing protein [Rhodanobacteraceae bacterium]